MTSFLSEESGWDVLPKECQTNETLVICVSPLLTLGQYSKT